MPEVYKEGVADGRAAMKKEILALLDEHLGAEVSEHVIKEVEAL